MTRCRVLAQMPDYPLDRLERIAARRRIEQRLLAEARQQARTVSRSITCATGINHSTCVGAAGCLCECHDPAGD